MTSFLMKGTDHTFERCGHQSLYSPINKTIHQKWSTTDTSTALGLSSFVTVAVAAPVRLFFSSFQDLKDDGDTICAQGEAREVSAVFPECS
ncbi:hypothetical protein Cni_G29049 [Canna indica]|uniref:Uncharacterized protein n=1 Tax=Canna indica TaxID=4628 RepID=A0AAQ3L4K9_9LILI|nr:hypothetical protein Cni_G29049 [Canna indica]